MQLYLMQHGLALSKEDDPERPLSPAGVDQVRESAAGIRQLRLSFDLIAASPKRRAQQTAALVAEAVRYPYSDILTTEALLPQANPEEVLTHLESEADDSRILLVGHLPLLEVLAARLLGGGQIAFEQAGLCLLEKAVADEVARLQFLLTAAHLSRFTIKAS